MPHPQRVIVTARSGRAVAMAVLAALVLGGCVGPVGGGGASGWREGGARPAIDGPGDLNRARQAVAESVQDLPKSRIGNTPAYTVFGQRYAVLDSAAGFSEEGVASWYGAKFHGRDTSSGEPYDMHLMTAAHKHLPLPTFVRVTRTDTGRSIVVKVNDRGPFVDDRIIDLSYGAAERLDMLGNGTAPVIIEALSTHLQDPASEPTAPPVRIASLGGASEGGTASPQADPGAGTQEWIQIGAFSDVDNAREALQQVAGSTGLGGRVELDARDALYRVRLGPLPDAQQRDEAMSALASAGVESYTMVFTTR